jgi:hypothetical protein
MTDKPGLRNYVDLAWVVAEELAAGEAETARGGYKMPWDTRTEITEEAWEVIRRGAPAATSEKPKGGGASGSWWRPWHHSGAR